MTQNNKGLEPVLCIVNPDDKYYMKQFPKDNNLRYCITPYEVEELQKKGVEFPADYLKEGVILMLEPFTSKYIFREPEDEDRIIKKRLTSIGTILSYLGAKRSTLIYGISRENEALNASKVGASANLENVTKVGDEGESAKEGFGVGGHLEYENSNSKDLKYDYSAFGESEWPGTYDENSYEKAVKLAFETGLDQDDIIKTILEERNPYHQNPVKHKHYKIELRSDIKKAMKTASDLQISLSKQLGLSLGPLCVENSTSFKTNINVNVESSEFAKKHDVLDFDIEFGEFIPKNKKEDSLAQVPTDTCDATLVASQSLYSQEQTNSVWKLPLLIGCAILVGAAIAVAVMLSIMS